MKCITIVKEVVDEATKQYGKLRIVNEERLADLEICCDFVDQLAQEVGGVSYSVDIDEAQHIHIGVECKYLEIRDLSHECFKISDHCKGICFETTEDNMFNICFEFYPVWDSVLREGLYE